MCSLLTCFTGGSAKKRRAAESQGDDSEEDDDDEEEGSDFEAPKKKKAKRKPKQNGEGERSANGFTKKYPVSKELEAWIGKPEVSRPELTSFFWQYVKEHGLQVCVTFQLRVHSVMWLCCNSAKEDAWFSSLEKASHMCVPLTRLAVGVQNPENKKEIICDDVLEKLTGEKKFPGFSLQKFLKSHINP